MGRLTSTDVIEIEEGVFVPAAKGLFVNGIFLGEPVEIEGDIKEFQWDHSELPNGTIDAEGNIVLQEVG